MKNILYTIAAILLLVALYYAILWKQADTVNHEPSVTLASLASSIVSFIMAWRYDGINSNKNNVKKTQINLFGKKNKNISTNANADTKQMNIGGEENTNKD